MDGNFSPSFNYKNLKTIYGSNNKYTLSKESVIFDYGNFNFLNIKESLFWLDSIKSTILTEIGFDKNNYNEKKINKKKNKITVKVIGNQWY